MVFTFSHHTVEKVTKFFNLYLISSSSEIPQQMQKMQCQVLQGLIGTSIAGVVRELDPTLDIYKEHLCCFSISRKSCLLESPVPGVFTHYLKSAI